MAEENKEQKPEQMPEREPAQGEGPEQGEDPSQEPEEAPQEEEPQKKEGLLMPILYALLAGVGAFTLVMILGIVLTFFFQPAEPEETPPAQQTSQVASTPAPTPTQAQDQ